MRILFNFMIIPSLISSRWCFIKNSRFVSLFKKMRKKGEIESNFLYTPFGRLKLNHYLVQYGFHSVIQFWLVSESVVKKLLLISPFVTNVQFVALKLILSNSLCMIIWFKLLFWELPLCKYCFIYTCALFCHFSGSIFTKKGILFKETRF